MTGKLIAAAAAAGCLVVASVPAQGATTAQVTAKCKAAWSGSTSTAAYRSYKSRCITAVKNAVSDATDVGNGSSATANNRRSKTRCGAKWPNRNTAAKRKAYNACLAASNASQKAFAPKPLKATLTGANEVPAAGAATGTASIRLNLDRRRVCATLTFDNWGASPPTAAHIHQAAAGAAGPVVIALGSPAVLNELTAHRKGQICVKNVATATIRAIRANPGNFYVNVHNGQFPGGAARGQLHK